MTDEVCCLKGCDQPHYCLGFCERHYDRIQPMDHPFRERKNRASGFGLSNEERFNRWVDKSNIDGCWLWQGKPDDRGYGVFSEVKDGVKGNLRRYFRAHRKSWERANGVPVPQGMVVRHKCDVKLCVRPDHLEIGTSTDNTQDNIDRDLYIKGSGHPMAKLNDDIVREIRGSKERAVVLAKRYSVSLPLIYKIRSGSGWKHVT